MPSALNYLIVHGSCSSPRENWFPWLEEQLEATGAKVFVPQFPTPEDQNLSAWRKVASYILDDCDPASTVLIGHSTGAVFVLRMAERTLKPYRAIYSVCPFAQNLALEQFDPLNSSFVHPAFDWAKVRRGARKITCFAGTNDPYVPLPYSQAVAKSAGAGLFTLEKAGHINAESGYHQFPLLLDKILEDIHG